MTTEKISIIIPAYNEERNITSVIQSVQGLEGYEAEIIVVDDGSQDRTAEVAKEAGVIVISYQPNQGKGAAFRKGIAAITSEYVIQIDADHQFQPSDIPKLIKALKDGADIVLGSRFKGGEIERGSVTRVNRFGNWLMSFATSLASGIKVYDIMAGFKGFKAEALKALNLQTNHFGYEAEIVVRAGKLGFKVAEVPITYKHRSDGRSNVKTIKDGTRVLLTILRTKLNIIK
jgi:glycosyltransferase involved in cell wall biosynthesis